MLSDSVFVPKVDSLRLQINFLHTKEGKTVEALVDTGATHNFITPKMAHYLNLNLTKLEKPRVVRNVDGTRNKNGQITHYVDLDFKDMKKVTWKFDYTG
jgi:hypothetical protein